MRARSPMFSVLFAFAGLVTLVISPPPCSATDIEELFQKQDDLSSRYTISTGLLPDSTTYGGTLKIEKP